VAYDEELAERVREAVGIRGPFDEMKMFGGLAFMVNTHMACGLIGNDLMVRVGSVGHDEALARGATEMDFTGRPMRGLVIVPGASVRDGDALEEWVTWAVDFAQTEPPKVRKQKPPKPRTTRS